MSDAISSEKISDYINIFLKKQHIYQKIDKIKSYSWYFILFSSFVGITGIYISYKNFYYIKKLNNTFKNNEKTIEDIKKSLNEIKTTLNDIKNSSNKNVYENNIPNSSSFSCEVKLNITNTELEDKQDKQDKQD